VFVKEKIEEFIAIPIMVAQAQRLYPKLDPFGLVTLQAIKLRLNLKFEH
jgi:hypothetical protein